MKTDADKQWWKKGAGGGAALLAGIRALLRRVVIWLNGTLDYVRQISIPIRFVTYACVLQFLAVLVTIMCSRPFIRLNLEVFGEQRSPGLPMFIWNHGYWLLLIPLANAIFACFFSDRRGEASIAGHVAMATLAITVVLMLGSISTVGEAFQYWW